MRTENTSDEAYNCPGVYFVRCDDNVNLYCASEKSINIMHNNILIHVKL